MKYAVIAAALLLPVPAVAQTTWFSPDFSQNKCVTMEEFFPGLGVHVPSDLYDSLKKDGYPVTEEPMYFADGSLEAVAFNIQDLKENGKDIFFTIWSTYNDCNVFMKGVIAKKHSLTDDPAAPKPKSGDDSI